MFNPLQTPIQVGGHTIRTEYDERLTEAGNWGTFNGDKDVISIYPNITDSTKTLTWIHELNEAIKQIFCNDEEPHSHIEQYAQGYFQILPQLGLIIEWQGGK